MRLADRARQAVRRRRREHEVHMVGHQAVGPDLDRSLAAAFGEQIAVERATRTLRGIQEIGAIGKVSPQFRTQSSLRDATDGLARRNHRSPLQTPRRRRPSRSLCMFCLRFPVSPDQTNPLSRLNQGTARSLTLQNPHGIGAAAIHGPESIRLQLTAIAFRSFLIPKSSRRLRFPLIFLRTELCPIRCSM
jgi:hypothetical protein